MCSNSSCHDGSVGGRHISLVVDQNTLSLFPINEIASFISVSTLRSMIPSNCSTLGRHDRRKFEFEANDQCLDEGLFVVSPRNESMLRIKILHDVVGTSGYHCGVLRSFPVERIKQGIRRVLFLLSPSRSNGVRSKRYHVVPDGEFDGIPIALVAWFGVAPQITRLDSISQATGRLAKWGVELEAYDIKYATRSAIKGQVLTDFLAETMTEDSPTQVKTDRPDDTLAEGEVMEEQEDAKTKAPENLRVETVNPNRIDL
ncbi:hypothetical protein Tco_0318626 [Tanacetum coccineum]